MKNCPKCQAKKKAAAKLSGTATTEVKIENILDSVSYQHGTIVSREIIRQKNGTVTVFAFDKGQGLSEHTAPFDALVQVLEGEVEIKID
ncbi:MAG: cupin domain-containing protein, partial [Candidatus Edwardsbacteria bacterium]|nr:cupin domain-containing protein [Candidatus Edwardsbacteria bacterium]